MPSRPPATPTLLALRGVALLLDVVVVVLLYGVAYLLARSRGRIVRLKGMILRFDWVVVGVLVVAVVGVVEVAANAENPPPVNRIAANEINAIKSFFMYFGAGKNIAGRRKHYATSCA